MVTTADGSSRWGMTVASFASLSLDPPLLLVCLESRVETCEAILRTRHFAVNILAADQGAVSNQFAARVVDRFAGVEIGEGSQGDPLVGGAATHIECLLHSELPGGDHTIIVGAVVAARTFDRTPLLYFGSQYRTMHEL